MQVSRYYRHLLVKMWTASNADGASEILFLSIKIEITLSLTNLYVKHD